MFPDIQENIKQSVIQEPVPRVTQQEIIIENEQTVSTLQSVVCPVCMLVLSLPHWVCEGCDNAICNPCLEEWWKKHPNCCIFKCQNTNFKVVKRSHTYQAVINLLKVKCKYCQALTPISAINAHDKLCGKKLIGCSLEGCTQVIARQLLGQHLTNCFFQVQQCRFCRSSFLIGAIENHQANECQQRVKVCENEGCKQQLKARQFHLHQQQCEFIRFKCQWCHNQIIKKTFAQHCQHCEKRSFTCKWCNNHFLGNQIKSHEQDCLEKHIRCQLCQEPIKEMEVKEHKLECMFKEIIFLKTSHYRLSEENVKLKMRVHELSIELEDSIKNRHQTTIESLIKIQEEEKKEYERDLLRIKNSIQSIKKCRNQELTEHLKKLHLSTTLCYVCSIIKKKLEDDLSPLLRLQQETILKIKQLERGEHATRQSMIDCKQH